MALWSGCGGVYWPGIGELTLSICGCVCFNNTIDVELVCDFFNFRSIYLDSLGC